MLVTHFEVNWTIITWENKLMKSGEIKKIGRPQKKSCGPRPNFSSGEKGEVTKNICCKYAYIQKIIKGSKSTIWAFWIFYDVRTFLKSFNS